MAFFSDQPLDDLFQDKPVEKFDSTPLPFHMVASFATGSGVDLKDAFALAAKLRNKSIDYTQITQMSGKHQLVGEVFQSFCR